MTERLRWGDAALTLEVTWSSDHAPYLSSIELPERRVSMPAGVPLVEVIAVGHGHRAPSARLVHSAIGARARMVRAHETPERLLIVVADPESGIEADVELRRRSSAAAVTASVTLRSTSTTPIIVRSAASFAAYLGGGSHAADWTIVSGRNDWLAENRWSSARLDGLLPAIGEKLTGHDPRGEHRRLSTGAWSTRRDLPVAVAHSIPLGLAWAWQIEHNGAWRWEVGRDTVDHYLALSGPTHDDHAWLARLEGGAEFTTVPVTIAWSSDPVGAIGELTTHRRADRRPHPDDAALPVIFNDYMNTLNGDPSTEKLLPLIDAAAAVGAEVFCIDAGWYDDGHDWWPSVGEWRPSSTRFPNGLGEVIDRIRDRGMLPGLWLEPEVVGIQSPVARSLPTEAFFQVQGERLIESERHHLDLRHPAARRHLDDVIDRLVVDFGIGYFKFDYNIDPGQGSDRDAISPGAALLEHNRAYSAWIDGILDRHPDLILENCGSGAMRADWAQLSRFQLQSTSDQQDPLRYPPIAAAAPMSMLPEQAASWAYPQPGMTPEQIGFCLTTSLLGRFFLSGYLNRMDDAELELVREAVSTAKDLRHEIRRSRPFWPLGLPGWDDPWVAVGLATDTARYIAVWNRDPSISSSTLVLDGIAAGDLASITTHFPRAADGWILRPLEEGGRVRVSNSTGSVAARVLRYPAPLGARNQAAAATRTDRGLPLN